VTFAAIIIGLLALTAGASFVVWLLRGWIKETGASEEREKQTYRKVTGARKANEAKDEVNGLSAADAARRLSEWRRK